MLKFAVLFILLAISALISSQPQRAKTFPEATRRSKSGGRGQTQSEYEWKYAEKFKEARLDGYEVFEIIRRDDRNCYNMGLLYENRLINGKNEGVLIESCGQLGLSRI